jgi:hypothetical protein
MRHLHLIQLGRLTQSYSKTLYCTFSALQATTLPTPAVRPSTFSEGAALAQRLPQAQRLLLPPRPSGGANLASRTAPPPGL